MHETLIRHIRNYVTLTNEEVNTLLPFLRTDCIPKKHLLLKAGHVCQSNYFVSKGCLRMYFLQEETEAEQITQFALENWWLTDNMSLLLQTPSQFYIQAIEASEIIAIDKKMEDELFSQLPQLERYFRLMLQRAHGASQLRIKYIFGSTGKERYHHFAKLFPDFMQRIPQYMLASYLGFSPEFLSKIRAQKE
ncbi:cAMP-binding domain of CRP or a regulatory subunit of cAMP-dependent protein kinases [Filimonas lacunae]|uniref:cAMP-binding domain of CRP or a regulatory subunit of cAMP-dependent protein kinases n=1 Tax=Filimonas lacunae TaxID=477680 RepID=A0A173MEA2_9BACT|nr:Crp/Fnr family transcriptional regulator [Filimonas lacunae]BAV05761.1 Crp/Fnr family transcriptional regulator [Filimonas lacunae]SIT28694.1 cAMP-binding domain of CRP or a regulatory subunit of cAMP-dependent protein kinases [Filimonas lacunae]